MKTIVQNSSLKINDNFKNEISNYYVDLEFVKDNSIEKLLIDSNYILNGVINAKLPTTIYNSVAFLLIKNEINCCKDCESGLYTVPYLP
jgi:hypothetical protein